MQAQYKIRVEWVVVAVMMSVVFVSFHTRLSSRLAFKLTQ